MSWKTWVWIVRSNKQIFTLLVSFITQGLYLCATNLPLQVLDTHFVSSFLIIVEPLSVLEINLGELRVGIDAIGQPLSLEGN